MCLRLSKLQGSKVLLPVACGYLSPAMLERTVLHREKERDPGAAMADQTTC